MPSTEVTRPPLQLLRESLRADSPVREASIAKLMVICTLIAIPLIFSLALFQSWESSVAINAYLVLQVAYYGVQLRRMKQGWYHPGIAWANVFVEVSLPGVILVFTSIFRGPEYTYMTPAHVVWGAMVVTSALRATPRLSLLAGIVAAVEWALIYGLLLYPQLPDDPAPSMRLPAAVLRSALLVMCGGFAYQIAAHFIRKTEEALVSVREQDLMGKYFLHERIGAGGMAEVYRATYCPEGGFQKPVAIKRVLPNFASSENFVEMFREEARLCASLNHPNIVQVFDCGRYRDSFILAMEYVDGLPLNRLLKRLQRPLPLNAVTYLAAELAAALDYIHRKVDPTGKPLNLVHRDVNPPNILISRIGEVKLGDFGVANAATRVEAGKEDIFYGKLHYSAPEQLVVGPFDGRADLFALGITLIETLTRAKVYTSDDDAALNKGIFPRIPRPSELRADVPEALDELIMRLVAQDRDRRPATGAEVRALFRGLTGELSPYPGGQQALVNAVEEALRGAEAPKPSRQRVTGEPKEHPAKTPAREVGQRLTEAFASLSGRHNKVPVRPSSSSKPALPEPGGTPQPLGSAARRAPTANMRAWQPGDAPPSTDAVETQAVTEDELARALGAPPAPKTPTRDWDEDARLDENDRPAAGKQRRR